MADSDIKTGGASGTASAVSSTSAVQRAALDETSDVGAGQLGSGVTVSQSGGSRYGGGVSFQDLDAGGSQELSALALQITFMSQDIQDNSATLAETLLKGIQARQKQLDALQTQNQTESAEKTTKAEKKARKSGLFGWIMLGVSTVMTIASAGSLTGPAVALMAISTGLGLAQQGLNAFGAFDKLAEKNPKAMAGINGAIMALQIVTSIASARFAKAAETVAEAAEVVSDVAAPAAQTATQVSTAAEGAADLAEVSQLAQEVSDLSLIKSVLSTGEQMTAAANGEEQAEIFLDGIDEALGILSDTAAGRTTSGGALLGEASLNEAAEGAGDFVQTEESVQSALDNSLEGIDESEGIVDDVKLQRVETEEMEKLDGRIGRVGATAQGVATVGKTAMDVQVAVLKKQIADLNAELDVILAKLGVDDELADEVLDQLKKILEYNKSFGDIDAKIESSVHETSMTISKNIA